MPDVVDEKINSASSMPISSSPPLHVEELAVNVLVRSRLFEDSGLFQSAHGRMVLDVGAGTGLLAEKLSAAGAVLTAIDINEENIQAIRRRLPRVRAYRADADNLDQIEGGSFDCIVCSAIIEHLNKPQLFLDQARRLLTENGHIYLSVDIRPRITGFLRRMLLDRILLNKQGHPEVHKKSIFSSAFHYSFWDERLLIDYMRSRGFILESAQYGGGVVSNVLDMCLLLVEHMTRKGSEQNLADHEYRLKTWPVRLYVRCVLPVIRILARVDNFKFDAAICLMKFRKSGGDPCRR